MDSIVKEYMAKNKVLIAYVRDVYGFRKGVAVALGENQFGFSMVNKTMDVEWKRMKPHQLPAVQRMMNAGLPAEDVVTSPAYRKCVALDNAVRVPKFDRKLGLMYAIDSALNKEIEFDGTLLVVNDRVPADADLIGTLRSLKERAVKYFSKKDNIPF